MKTIKSGMVVGDSPKKMFCARVSPHEQGSRASARQQASHLRRLKLRQWSGGKKVEAPKDGRIAFYSRTSVVEQGKEGSWERRQIKATNDYLKHLGLPPLSRKDIYFDRSSGANLNRPALSKLIDCVKEGKIQTIVVLRIDRLGRNLRDFVALMDILDSHNVSLRSVEEGIDTSSEMGKFTFSIMRLLSDCERAALKKRLLAGKERRRQRLAQEGDKQGGKNK